MGNSNLDLGKKLQLSDQEIKADLLQIKEMFKVTESVQGYSETNISEIEVAAESMEETAVDKSDDKDSSSEEKVGAKARNSRARPQRRPAARGKSKTVIVQTVTKGKED